MRVLVLSSMYPNSEIYLSGIFVHEQVKELINLGIDVKVIAPTPYTPILLEKLNKKWGQLSKIPSRESIDGVDVLHSKYTALPGGYFKQFWAYSYLLSLIKNIGGLKEIKKYDLIHAHGSLPNDYSGYMLAKLSGLPLVVTVHGESIYYLPKHPRKFKYSLIALNYADAIVVVSNQVKSRVKEYLPQKEFIKTIYNGFNKISVDDFSIDNQNERIRILYAGNLIERKGTEYLLKAFADLKPTYEQIELRIAGGGELFEKLKKVAEDLRIKDKVIFTGSLSHSDMLKEISQSDIFVMPSWDEAFGVVYLEALSFKKPIIGSEKEGISDIIKDGENGLLVEPRNIESLVKKLKLLIENENLRNEFGSKGYDAIKDLTWTNNAKQNIEVYQKVLESWK